MAGPQCCSHGFSFSRCKGPFHCSAGEGEKTLGKGGSENDYFSDTETTGQLRVGELRWAEFLFEAITLPQYIGEAALSFKTTRRKQHETTMRFSGRMTSVLRWPKSRLNCQWLGCEDYSQRLLVHRSHNTCMAKLRRAFRRPGDSRAKAVIH